MTKKIVLDTGPLSKLCDPARNQELSSWLKAMLAANAEIYVPEIADYEARRGMLHRNMARAITRLNQLGATLIYLPLDTEVMRRAAELWAKLRKKGQPTADPHALDGDVILAAQAEKVGGIVATENVGHLTRVVRAKHWNQVRP